VRSCEWRAHPPSREAMHGGPTPLLSVALFLAPAIGGEEVPAPLKVDLLPRAKVGYGKGDNFPALECAKAF